MARTIKNRKLIKSEKGSVMMEYLILNLGFFVVLALAAHFCMPDFETRRTYKLDSSGDISFEQDERKPVAGRYGHLGEAFLQHYNMVLEVISMPYP